VPRPIGRLLRMRAFSWLLLRAVLPVIAVMAVACGSQDSCAETATCDPVTDADCAMRSIVLTNSSDEGGHDASEPFEQFSKA
jgi:hypothetical protein